MFSNNWGCLVIIFGTKVIKHSLYDDGYSSKGNGLFYEGNSSPYSFNTFRLLTQPTSALMLFSSLVTLILFNDTLGLVDECLWNPHTVVEVRDSEIAFADTIGFGNAFVGTCHIFVEADLILT